MKLELFSFPDEITADFSLHNTKQKQVWDCFYGGSPVRIPMTLGVNPRFLLCDPKYNKNRIAFRDYMTKREVMLRVQCEFSYYKRHYLRYDQEMGIPEAWPIYVDTQNISEAAWFGAEIAYPDFEVPSTRLLLTEDNKNYLFEKGIPDPFSGIFETARDFYEYFNNGKHRFLERPVICEKGGQITDGPMTIACNLRGAAEFCMDLYLDTDYAVQLLDYITQATIQRIKAWYTYYGLPLPESAFFADDSIALLSTEDYKRFILPFHKKLVDGISLGTKSHGVHLCGDATRHFPLMHKELNICFFDTGYPVRHGELVKTLGENVVVQGGPTVDLIKNGTKEQVIIAVKEIIDSVKTTTQNFIMRDANNLAPGTPIENINAMYETVCRFGKYNNF